MLCLSVHIYGLCESKRVPQHVCKGQRMTVLSVLTFHLVCARIPCLQLHYETLSRPKGFWDFPLSSPPILLQEHWGFRHAGHHISIGSALLRLAHTASILSLSRAGPPVETGSFTGLELSSSVRLAAQLVFQGLLRTTSVCHMLFAWLFACMQGIDHKSSCLHSLPIYSSLIMLNHIHESTQIGTV